MENVIGPNIRRYREQRPWTQAHLAEAARISERTVQRAESGELMSAETLQAIAGALDVTVDDLRRLPNQDEIDKAKKLAERYSVVRLARIERASELCRILDSTDAMNFEWVDPQSDAEDEAAAELEQHLKDMANIWSDLEPMQRHEAAADLQSLLDRIDSLGFVVTAGTHPIRFKSFAEATRCP